MRRGVVTTAVEMLEVDGDRLDDACSFSDLGVDSLALVELSMVLGKEHGLHISDDELFDRETVGDIVALMEERAGDRS